MTYSFTADPIYILFGGTTGSKTVTFTINAQNGLILSNVTVTDANLKSAGNNVWTFEKIYAGDSIAGTYTHTATITDGENNTTTANVTITIARDDTPPLFVSTATKTTLTFNEINKDATQDVIFIATELDDSIVSVTFDDDAAVEHEDNTAPWLYTKTYSAADWSEGSSTDNIKITARDAVGNESSQIVPIIIKKDIISPTITLTLPGLDPLELYFNGPDQTDIQNIILTSTDTDISTIDLPNTTHISTTTAQGVRTDTYQYTFNSNNYQNGILSTEVLSATVTDNMGNSSTETVSVNIYRDDTPPIIQSVQANFSSFYFTGANQEKIITFQVLATDIGLGLKKIVFDGEERLVSGTNPSAIEFTRTFYSNDYINGEINEETLFNVFAEDKADNQSTLATIGINVTRDDIAPTIEASVSPTMFSFNSTGQEQLVTVTVSASDNISGVDSITMSPDWTNSNVVNPWIFTKTFNSDALGDGTHNNTYDVTVTDNAGNTSTSQVQVTINKDSTSPTIIENSFISDVTNDTIILKTSSKTKTVNFQIKGLDNTGLSIESLRIPDAPEDTVVLITTDNDGHSVYNWSEQFVYDDYSYGVNNIQRRAQLVDSFGNYSTEVTWSGQIEKLDDENPIISNFSITPDTVTLSQDNTIQEVTITLTAQDNQTVTNVSLIPSNGAPSIGTPTIDGLTYTWTSTFLFSDYAIGDTINYSYSAQATDTANNNAEVSKTITILARDTQNPIIQEVTVSDSSFNLYEGEQKTVNIAVWAIDETSVQDVFVSGATLTGVSSIFSPVLKITWNFQKTYSFTTLPVYGVNYDDLQISVVDGDGNTTTQTERITISKIDSIEPIISSFTSESSIYNLYTSTQDVSTAINLTAQVSDNDQVQTVSVPGFTVTDNGDNTYTFTKNITYDSYDWGDNNETYTLTATDPAGNQNVSNVSVTIRKHDDEPPDISTISISPSYITLSSINNSQTVTITATVTDNRGVTEVSLPGFTEKTHVGNNYSWERTYIFNDYIGSTESPIVNNFTITASDAAGNIQNRSGAILIAIQDLDAPVISSISAENVNLYTSNKTVSGIISATITDDWTIASVTLTKVSDGSIVGVAQPVNGDIRSWAIEYTYSNYNYGSNTETYRITATDSTGNVATEDVVQVIEKYDDEAPLFQYFPNTTSSPININLIDPLVDVTLQLVALVNDNVGIVGTPTLTVTPSPVVAPIFRGGGLNGGTYTWTKTFVYADYNYGDTVETYSLVAVDAAGNETTVSGTVHISKPDIEPPQIEAVNITETPVFNDSITEITTYIYARITDNTGAEGLTFTIPSGGAVYDPVKTASMNEPDIYYFKVTLLSGDFLIGETARTVTIRASDQAGNWFQKWFTYYVRKTIAYGVPTILWHITDIYPVILSPENQTVEVEHTVNILADTNITVSLINGTFISGPPVGTIGGGEYKLRSTHKYGDYVVGTNYINTNAVVVSETGIQVSDNLALRVDKSPDIEAPVITNLQSDISTVVLREGESKVVTFTATITDQVGVTSAVLSTANADINSPVGDIYTWTKTYNYSTNAAGSEEFDTLTLTAQDDAGLTTTSTITITIHHTTYTDITTAVDRYIVIETDLNNSIIQENGFLGFTGGIAQSGQGRTVSYHLPSGEKQLLLGNITGIGLDSNAVGQLNAYITISVDSSGEISAITSVSGDSMTVTVDDDNTKAQAVYWPHEPTPTVTSSSADKLSAEFNSADAETYYNETLQAIADIYTGNAITSWNIEVSNVPASKFSEIHEYARYNGRVFPNIFNEGEQIILSTEHPYQVTVKDINDNTVEIIPPTNIRAVVKHKPNAISLQSE